MYGTAIIKENKKAVASSSLLMIFTIAALGIVIYFGNLLTINTSKITDLICLVSFPFLPVSSIVSSICFLIPLHSGITGLYVYGYAVLMLLIKTKTFKIKAILPMIVIVLYEMAMMLLAGSQQIMHIVVYALAIFLLLYIMNTEEANPEEACFSYICGTLVLLISIFTTAIQNNSLEMILTGTVRIGSYEGIEEIGQVAVVTENANAMAYYALVAIMIAFGLIKNASFRGKIFLLFSMLISTFIALFTVSRTFAVALVVMLALASMTNYNLTQRLKVFIIIFVILFLTVPFLLRETEIYDAFLARFEEDDLTSDTGRSKIFKDYMDFLWNNPLRMIFGTGAVFYREVCNLKRSMHNGTQQILVSYGLLGFIPMLSVLFSPVTDYFKKNKFKLAKLIPLISVIAFVQTIQFLNPNNLMLPFAIAILYMKIPDKESNQCIQKSYKSSPPSAQAVPRRW